MRDIVTLISAAAFLLHFALGCCAHHAHAAPGETCNHSTAVRCVHDGHEHDGHSHDDEGTSTPSPTDSESPGQSCKHGQCVFMAAGKTEVAKTSFVGYLPHFALEPVSSTGIPSLDTAALYGAGHDLAPPVRTHLLHQVLLN